jgi:hypothetical protein
MSPGLVGNLIASIVLAGSVVTSAGPVSPVQTLPINDRPATAKAQIANSRKRYDGAFALTGRASICGVMPKDVIGEDTFIVEFGTDVAPANGSIVSIAFGSKRLVGGVTTSGVFRLSVSVKLANGGGPPAYVLNTDGSIPKSTGSASVTQKGSITTLKVTGQNDMGETIDLEVTCR